MLESLQSMVTVVGTHLRTSPVHVAMLHQSMPEYENLSPRLQSLFLRTSAHQIGSLRPRKCQL